MSLDEYVSHDHGFVRPQAASVSRAMRPLPALLEYAGEGNGNPIIHDTWTPGGGWARQTYRKRASAAHLRKLRAQGVERVGLVVRRAADGVSVVADFSIRELLASARRAA
jgi:hypothetical protein